MRYAVLLLSGLAWMTYLHAQCTACTPDPSKSPTPYGFNPPILYVRPNTDTTLVVYFTFPDEVRQGNFTVYPNYAIWVDSLRLDSGRVTLQNGQPFMYNSANPDAGGIRFDQLHRAKRFDPNDTRTANFVVYQNPGGTAGQTPPIGCARVCIKGGSQGSDTLRVKVRVFIPTIGDVQNKDTANLTPTLLGNQAWLDTTFRYVILVTPTIPTSLGSVAASKADFTVYPNPTRGESIVRFTLAAESLVRLRVFSSDGREVYTHAEHYSAGSHEHLLRLPAGIYVVHLETSGTYLSERIVVLE
ncbi:MAG: T9SS type A sorting domain-containing protein [Bacteroidia bacterium]|nr:T9SS type A sorting domain-containing protein [Bacteroidia bacterium]